MKPSTSPKGRRAEQGYILLFVLVALLAVAALVPLFARSLFERTRTTLKTERQDLAAAELEARYADFRAELRRALATGAQFAFEGSGQGALQNAFRSDRNSLYTLEVSLAGAGTDRLENRPPLGPDGVIATFAGMADETEGLPEMRDDPFFGVPALVVPVTLHAVLTPRLAPASNSDPAALEGRLRLAFRLIPASSFSLASWGDLSLDAASADSAGRVYAKGHVLSVAGAHVRVPWKLAAGATVQTNDGSSLLVSATPNDAAMRLERDFSTAAEAWLNLRATWREGPLPISTGREVPIGLILPIPLATMLAPSDPDVVVAEPGEDSPERLKFERHATFTVTVDTSGALTFGGAALPLCKPHVITYLTTRNTSGERIVRLDVARLVEACTEQGQPARIFVRSARPGAIVLLYNGADLPAPFSVATPHPVYVAGEFNAAGRAASIVTAARVTSVIAEY